MNLKDRIRKSIREMHERRGTISLEFVIGTLIFIIVFAAICDLFVYSTRTSMMTDQAKELARTLSVQGGAQVTKPGGYADNYYTISDLATMVDKNMKSSGFKDGDWYFTIEYTKIFIDTDGDGTEDSSVDFTDEETFIRSDKDAGVQYGPTRKMDYLSDFTLKVYAKYDWVFTRTVFGDRTGVMTVSMPGTSEWKIDYNNWSSEN